MLTKRKAFSVLGILAVAAALLIVIPQQSRVSAQMGDKAGIASGTVRLGFADGGGALVEGAWLARGSFTIPGAGSGTFPFIAHFHRDGTFTMSTVFETAGAGPAIPPPFRSNTALTGSWKRVGAREIVWQALEIVSTNPTPGGNPNWFFIVGRGSHEIAPGDPDHAEGNISTLLYACPPTPASITSFQCPTWDDIASGAVSPVGPAFPPAAFRLTHIRP